MKRKLDPLRNKYEREWALKESLKLSLKKIIKELKRFFNKKKFCVEYENEIGN